jgi:hypothetical protein
MNGNEAHMEELKQFILDEDGQEADGFSSFEGAEDWSGADEYVEAYDSFKEDSDTDDKLTIDELDDIDFSEFKGNFKSKLGKISNRISTAKKKRVKKKFAKKGKRKIKQRILIPSDRQVIIEGVDRFMLSNDVKDDAIKNIGFYKGEKLKELVLTFNNATGQDLTMELFNPSMPLDYLYSTSLNLNDRVQVAGGGLVSYSDVLFNLLANPTLLVNAKMVFSGANLQNQINQPLFFKNKTIEGRQRVEPLQTQLYIDNMQVANDIVFFDIKEGLNRPYIPDGMDIIEYTILAGMTVTIAFFYKQHSLKKFFFKEARMSKGVL